MHYPNSFAQAAASGKLVKGLVHVVQASIDGARILLRRDRIIRAMLEQLGAAVTDVTEPFTPAHGAYHAHEH